MALFSAFRAERQRQGLSLDDASARSGIDRTFLSKIETGKMPNPTVSTVRTYAEALGFHLHFRLGPIGADPAPAQCLMSHDVESIRLARPRTGAKSPLPQPPAVLAEYAAGLQRGDAAGGQPRVDVAGVVGDAELLPDQRGDALGGPQLGGEAELGGRPGKPAQGDPALLGGQPGSLAGGGRGGQAGLALQAMGCHPTAKRADLDA